MRHSQQGDKSKLPQKEKKISKKELKKKWGENTGEKRMTKGTDKRK